jgi:hypothetical protein
MPRRAARIDANHTAIVRALRDIGASVESLASQGRGCPDVLCGYRGVNTLIEIKNPNVDKSHQQLTTHERKWHDEWRGTVVIVWTVDDALRAVGALES